MDPDQWQRASELFLAALEQDETSCRRFVEEAAAGDPELLHDVEQLLASDAQAGTFMAAAAGRRVSLALAADVPTVAPDPTGCLRVRRPYPMCPRRRKKPFVVFGADDLFVFGVRAAHWRVHLVRQLGLRPAGRGCRKSNRMQ